MKESISYVFLLNIVITFIFVCFAVTMGIFSYYRAYKASNIIINEIEKYEGYNCISKETIEQKLQTITYNPPFNVTCKSNDVNCEVDNNSKYAVIPYNLDYKKGKYLYDDTMNTQYTCSSDGNCTQTRQYQYGVYTYMYVDLPVISHMMKIRLFSKTKPMYEFRSFTQEYKSDGTPVVYDIRNIPDRVMKIKNENTKIANLSHDVTEYYAIISTEAGKNTKIINNSKESDIKISYQYDANLDTKYGANDASMILQGYETRECGIVRDYSKWR